MANKRQRKILLAQKSNAQKEHASPSVDGVGDGDGSNRDNNATNLENGTKIVAPSRYFFV